MALRCCIPELLPLIRHQAAFNSFRTNPKLVRTFLTSNITGNRSQVVALAVFCISLGVTSASSNICRRSTRVIPHQFCSGSSRPIVASMAHKEKDAVQIDVAGKAVKVVGGPGVSEPGIKKALESVLFRRWLDYMKSPPGILSLGGSGGARCSLNQIVIQNVDYFGQRVGFVKFKAEVIDEQTGSKLPGIVFARGGAVGILMLLECEGNKYAVVVEQARVPVGRTIMELPAGMLDDDSGDFVGTAAREVEEETGIEIKTSDLFDLTALLNESTGRKMFPSPGGSDEEITLFLHRSHVKKEVIDSLQGQETGLRAHGELIKVHVVPYDNLWRISPDSKVLAAIALYETALRLNLLPAPQNAPDLSNL